jgi:hypothetical protein
MLSRPDVTVSRHPAPHSPAGGECDQLPVAKRRGGAGLMLVGLLQPAVALAYLPLNRLNLCMAHRARQDLVTGGCG